MKFYLNNCCISNGVLKYFLRCHESGLTTSVTTFKIKPEA